MTILFTPDSYLAASAKEKDYRCNGCGPKGLGGWLVPDTLYGLSITEACNVHDWMYSEGSTLEDKEKADRVFLNNMVRIIQDGSNLWILRRMRLLRAKNYYNVVRILGGPSFWDGKDTEEDSTFYLAP